MNEDAYVTSNIMFCDEIDKKFSFCNEIDIIRWMQVLPNVAAFVFVY